MNEYSYFDDYEDDEERIKHSYLFKSRQYRRWRSLDMFSM